MLIGEKQRESRRRRAIVDVAVVVSLMIIGTAAGLLVTLHIQSRPEPTPVNVSAVPNPVGTIPFP